MNLLPKSKSEFSQKEYWDSFFKKRGKRAFEWYGEYPELMTYLHKYIKKQDSVLLVGCGNSALGCDLYDVGFSNIINIDISPVVIKQMIQKEKDRQGLKFYQMDAMNMSFMDENFNVVLDKGTLDALMPDDKEETLKNIATYFAEIQRVLKQGGRYICISLLQEHILKYVIEYFPKNNWMVRIVRCHEAENKAIENNENCMPVFIIICTKFKQLPRQILEINLSTGDKMQKMENSEDLISNILNVQQAAFICSGLRNTSISDEMEVSFEMYKPGEHTSRYTIYVVGLKTKPKNSEFAAFIVPQGREAEWLFSTKKGRQQLVQMTNHNRLAIITLHRNQIYESLDSVKFELTDIIRNLAPSTLSQKIPFLSLGSDVGKRTVRYKGNSKYSGEYVVEDVEIENGEILRRLFFLNSQLVIQSEAKLKSTGIIDLNYLTCKHHIYMSLAAALIKTKRASLCVIGLGGGGLCSFLNLFLRQANILGVDIDEEMQKIGTDWFGLHVDSKLKVMIQDGIEFLKCAVLKENKFDAILFDVDSKDTSIGMSCPPRQFLDESTLTNVSKLIGNTGIFILNMVIRDSSLRPTIINDLKSKFQLVVSYKLDEDLNEIVICLNSQITVSDIKSNLKACCIKINTYFKKHNVDDNEVDIDDFMKELKINT